MIILQTNSQANKRKNYDFVFFPLLWQTTFMQNNGLFFEIKRVYLHFVHNCCCCYATCCSLKLRMINKMIQCRKYAQMCAEPVLLAFKFAKCYFENDCNHIQVKNFINFCMKKKCLIMVRDLKPFNIFNICCKFKRLHINILIGPCQISLSNSLFFYYSFWSSLSFYFFLIEYIKNEKKTNTKNVRKVLFNRMQEYVTKAFGSVFVMWITLDCLFYPWEVFSRSTYTVRSMP